MRRDGVTVFCGISRNATPPWGMDGGGLGSCNYVEVEDAATQRVTRLHHHPIWPVNKGDRVRVISGGGGGWGDPRDRGAADIAADIKDGLLSQDQARDLYGDRA